MSFETSATSLSQEQIASMPEQFEGLRTQVDVLSRANAELQPRIA